MAIPELDLKRIEKWCEEWVPEEQRDSRRLCCTVAGDEVTVCWCVYFPNLLDSPGWIPFPRAVLQFDPDTHTWTVFWIGREAQTRECATCEPSTRIEDAIACIEDDAEGYFCD